MVNLVYLPVNQLHPHPDNPRKELGDLTELAASIRANGVLQNLTVVPRMVTGEITGKSWQDGYTVIIGHRRLAAAKEAGLKEVPCVVANMTLREQARTMLVENMQRSDLTLYEQACGFQMMLDLGDTIDEVAHKSGFSETTVRRRVKLLQLNPEKFRASCARGATLSDYLELDKIKDPDLREKVMDSIGTNNFRQELAAAIGEEKCRELLEFVIAEVSPWAAEIPSGYKSGEYLYLRNYGRWNWKLGENIEQPEDAAPGVYYYYVGKEQIDLFRKHGTEPEKSAEETRREQLNAAANHQMAVLSYLDRQMYELRCEFVLSLSDAELERNREAVEAFAASTLNRAYCEGYRRLQNDGLMNDLVDLPAELACFDKREERREWIDELAQTKPLRVLFAAAYAAVDDDDCGYHVRVWDADTGTRAKYTRNCALDRVYALLERLGYEMSDEEIELQNGTHPGFTLEVDECSQ